MPAAAVRPRRRQRAAPVRQLPPDVDPHSLGLGEICYGFLAVLAAIAGVARATPGKADIRGAERVGPNRAGLESPDEAVHAADVRAPDAGGEAVLGAVGHPDGVLIVVEADDGCDRAEDLLLRDAHLMFD